MAFMSSRARLGFAFALPALALTLACGGAASSSSASTSAPAPSPSHTTAPPAEPFWSSDSPSRPHRAALLHPYVPATGSVVQLAPGELELFRTAASEPRALAASTPASTPTFATPLRIVTGLRSITYHQADSTTLQPFNLSAAVIQALVPNTAGGFDTLTGVGHDDGTFSIQNVPVGYYWLKFGKTYLWTSLDNAQWIYDNYGRADAEYPGIDPTNLSLDASNLNAWQTTDQFFWTVPNEGFSTPTNGLDGITNAPTVGATALNAYTMDLYTTGLPLLDATKGDQAYLTQLTSRTVSSETYRALGKVFNLPATTTADGATTAVSGGFLDIPQTATFRLAWKRSAFAALTPFVNPNATVASTEVGLWASPLGTGMGIPGDAFQLFTYDSGSVASTTDLDLGDLAYGNPFPSSWTPIAEAYFTWAVSYMAPGATTPVTLTRSAYTGTTTMPSASAPIAPLLTPVQNPRINGKSLFQNQLSVGLAPVLAWDAPATGSPAGYVVTAYQLINNAGASRLQSVATMRTASRQITLPPGVFAAGNTYVFSISAVKSPGVSYASNPYQAAFPYATAPILSAIVAP